MALTNHEFVMNGTLELNDFPTADNDSQIPDDFLARSKNDIGPVTPTCGSSDKDVARNRLAYISFLSGSAPASNPDPTAVVKQVVTAVGGEDKLLRSDRRRDINLIRQVGGAGSSGAVNSTTDESSLNLEVIAASA